MYMKPPLSIHHMRRRALTSVSKRMQAHATPQGSAGVSNNACANKRENKRERKQPQGSAGVSNNACANKRESKRGRKQSQGSAGVSNNACANKRVQASP